ncbi:MAG: NAD(P)-binding domain-containing protein [Planctomycetota bacterium]
MNTALAFAVGTSFVALLVLLAFWQKKITQAQRDEALADMYEAHERGLDRPVAQHPQINPQSCIGCASCVAACPESGVLGMVEGIAKVIQASRCIGHSLCEEACPVGAIQVGLGDSPIRLDLPVLDGRGETSVPGVYVAGELGGLALIRNATKQGAAAIDAIATDLAFEKGPKRKDGPLDVLIVGAGPAGLAAALRAKERRLRYLVIDREDVGGTVRKYPRRKLTLTGPMTMPLYGKLPKTEFLKEELIELWEEIIARYELEIETGVSFEGVDGMLDEFVVRTSRGDIATRRVILALGRRGTPRKLGVPGEDLEKVQYQLIDAATYHNEHILIVGGGDSALEAATALANQPGNVVTLSYRKDQFFRVTQRNRERIEQYAGKSIRVVFNSTLERVDNERSVVLSIAGDPPRKARLENDYVFIFAGGEPPFRLLSDAGVRLGRDEVVTPSSEYSDAHPVAR